MSKFEAPLTKFTLEIHPNADTLSIAQVSGCQCVIIKPLQPRWDAELGRVILKVISEQYLM